MIVGITVAPMIIRATNTPPATVITPSSASLPATNTNVPASSFGCRASVSSGSAALPLYREPGIGNEVTGALPSGLTVEIIAAARVFTSDTMAERWLQLANELWVRERDVSLAGDCDDLNGA